MSAISAAAQVEVPSGSVAATPANCVIQLSVGNPNPGNQEIPRSLVMSGTAFDSTATSGTGISRVEAFVGNRDEGGTSIGTASFRQGPGVALGTWSLNATIPTNINGGQDLFVYGQSAVSGQEAMVSVPIGLSQSEQRPPISNTAESFCPAMMATTAPGAIGAPIQAPTAMAIPLLATPTPQPATSAKAPVATPTLASVAATEVPGSVAAGAHVYQETGCVSCHGPSLDGQGAFPPLVGRSTVPDFPSTQVLFDYVRRSMPYTSPGSLTDEETYSVLAYLLNKNSLLPDDGTITPDTIGSVTLPGSDPVTSPLPGAPDQPQQVTRGSSQDAPAVGR